MTWRSSLYVDVPSASFVHVMGCTVRTPGKISQVPVSAGGTILGTDLGKIKAGGDGVGLRMYDPGYVNTAAVKSRICFIDGNKGILRYRGYPIEQVRASGWTASRAPHLLCTAAPTRGRAGACRSH